MSSLELSIDTSTRYASAALSRQGEVAWELTWRSEQNHSVEFVPALRHLMEQANVEMGQIEAIFVAKGPGGFSALRVGISFAKALAVAKEIPLVAVGTLEIEAQPYLGLGIPVRALIEAGREKLYAAAYGAGEQADDSRAASHRVETHESLVASVSRSTLFCGEGVPAVADMLRESLVSTPVIVDTPSPTRKPSVLAKLGHSRLRASVIDDPESLQPLYMRGSQFEVAQRGLGTA